MREALRSRFFVGVDLGQARDFTAVAVLERAEMVGEWDAAMYAFRKDVELRLRSLTRLELGMPYPEVARRVVKMTRHERLAERCELAVDATGVGRPVVDMLRQADPGCPLKAVTITGGDRESQENGQYRAPKRDLIAKLQVLLQQEKLRVARELPCAGELVKELMEMRVKVTDSGHEQMGVWREGVHDDLVLAVALACWTAGKGEPLEPQGNDRWWRRIDQPEWIREQDRVMRGGSPWDFLL